MRFVMGAALLTAILAAAPVGAVEAVKMRPPAPGDPEITDGVLNRISGRPGLDVSAVTAEVTAGVLKLSGSVATLFDRREVERLASGVRGVVSIDDRIEVSKGTHPDSALEVEADRALGGLPRLRAFRIGVAVTSGILVLSGEVPLARDRLDAEESASRVPGVQGVRNEITLAPFPIDPDRLRQRLTALLQHQLVFGGVEDLDVQAEEGGSVTLTGVVMSEADRRQAERLAYGVRGVVKVTNKLVIRLVGKPQAPEGGSR